jgi:hypothetical protein
MNLEKVEELKELAKVATDMGLTAEARTRVIELLGNIGTCEALFILLGLARNEKLSLSERDFARKLASRMMKF